MKVEMMGIPGRNTSGCDRLKCLLIKLGAQSKMKLQVYMGRFSSK